MYLSTLNMSAVYTAPCRRCLRRIVTNSGAGTVPFTTLLSDQFQNNSNMSKVGMKASQRWHTAYRHSGALWPNSKRDLVTYRQLGCEKSKKDTRAHTTQSAAAAGKPPLHQHSAITVSDLETGEIELDDTDRGWILPKGVDTGIRMYNSLTRKKERFILPNGRIATWYACGPTVYDHAHIGHASSYMRSDIIRRILINHFNIDVVMVMGVTDIDDKIIKRTKETGVTHRHLTRVFEDEFFKDMGSINVMPPTVKTRVTEHIPNIIYFITKLIDQDFGYRTPSGTVYFDVQRYGRYGRLWTHRLDTQIRDSFDKEKRGPRDFALWKAAKPDEPSWDSPWGAGRPGWHIECSTMASSIFGDHLDIHSGGDDLRFPHHENEMAQSESCLCTKQWTNYWMHTGHLHLKSDNIKMSKSLNNTIRINELLRKTTAGQFRVFCMLRPYRQHIEFSSESMLKAVRIHDTFMSFMSLAEAYIHGQVHAQAINEPALLETLLETKVKVDHALADDFDTPKAIGAMEELIRKTNTELGHKAGPEEPFVSRSAGTVASVLAYVERMLNVWGVQPPHKKLRNDAPNNSRLGASSDSDLRFNTVMDSVIQFRSKIREYALNPQERVSQDDLTSRADQELSPKERKRLQFQKVRPLLDACDELRDDLKLDGVIIQDHSKQARWLLDKKLPSNRGCQPTDELIKPSTRDPA